MASFEHNADPTAGSQVEDEKKKEAEHGHGHSHEHADGHVAAKIVALGSVTLGGSTFIVDREGQVEAGKETEFGVEHIGGPLVVPSGAWVANPDGEKLCDPVAGEGHEQHWHFNVMPLEPVKKSKFVLRVGEEEAVLDFCHGAQPCQDGILSVFKAAHDPEFRAFLELKLHDDAGDLELWLYSSAGVRTAWRATTGKPQPFDIPKDSVLRLTFPNHGGKTIELRVRDADENKDEDGTPNMRGGATNYFVFPGESGQDPEWLMGEKWRGTVSVAFEVDGKSYACDPFVLVPHGAL